MGLKVAFQMDPIENVDIKADSTFRIMEEAQNRGHELYYYLPTSLSYQDQRVRAQVWSIKIQRVINGHYELSDSKIVDLNTSKVRNP